MTNCPHHGIGCCWIGHPSLVLKHVEECPYADSTCRHCGEMMLQWRMCSHICPDYILASFPSRQAKCHSSREVLHAESRDSDGDLGMRDRGGGGVLGLFDAEDWRLCGWTVDAASGSLAVTLQERTRASAILKRAARRAWLRKIRGLQWRKRNARRNAPRQATPVDVADATPAAPAVPAAPPTDWCATVKLVGEFAMWEVLAFFVNSLGLGNAVDGAEDECPRRRQWHRGRRGAALCRFAALRRGGGSRHGPTTKRFSRPSLCCRFVCYHLGLLCFLRLLDAPPAENCLGPLVQPCLHATPCKAHLSWAECRRQCEACARAKRQGFATAEPPSHHEAAAPSEPPAPPAPPDASRTWRRGARTLCTQVAHTALFSVGLWWGNQHVVARVPLQVAVASTMYAAVLAMSRALPCHTDHCRWRTAAAVMLATSVVVCPCVAAVLGLAVATVLPRSFLWWPKKKAGQRSQIRRLRRRRRQVPAKSVGRFRRKGWTSFWRTCGPGRLRTAAPFLLTVQHSCKKLGTSEKGLPTAPKT